MTGADGLASGPAAAREASIDRSLADIEAIGERFGAAILASGTPLGQATVVVERARLLELARFLRDELGYGLLRSVTAIDFLPSEPRFQVVVHLTALPGAPEEGPVESAAPGLLRVKVGVPSDDPVVDSLTSLYPGANWHEREVYDMFGIDFAGHPDLRRILMPDAFDGHPLRKDFPLQYEEVAFSHNFERVHRAKPRAER